MSDPKRARQAAALGAIVFGACGLGLAVVVAVQEFPRGPIALGWILLLVSARLLEELVVVAALMLSLACARAAFSFRIRLPRVPAPQRPVLFFNPKSGGGKAARFKVADEARARGIEPIELGPPWDLEQLVRDAVAGGADGLAMAGGDGSQAIVASIAAELDLPYACIPRARATTSRSTSASIARTSWVRSTRSSTAASATSTWLRSTSVCS
jgi:hypothetical protein